MGRKRKGNDTQEFFTWDYLMGQTDCDNEVPSFFMAISSVRGPGKTYDMCSQMLKQRLGHECALSELIGTEREICLICRTKKQIGSFAEGVFGTVISDKYPNTVIEETSVGGDFGEITWVFDPNDEELCEKKRLGWVIPLNSRGAVKTSSSMFTKIGCVFMDEMIPEKGDPYVPEEFDKLVNILDSISRGDDESPHAIDGMIRYLPTFFAANAITIDNPYFEGFDLCSKLQNNTILYRGEGIVYQRCDNINAIKRQNDSRIHKAIKGYKSSCTGFKNDISSMICKPDADWGPCRYECTLVYEGDKLGVRYYYESGIYYISHKIDSTSNVRYSLTASGEINTAFIKTSRYFKTLREAMFNGLIRYQSSRCKSVFENIKI